MQELRGVRTGRVVHYVPEPTHAGPVPVPEHWTALVTGTGSHGDDCVFLTITAPAKGPCNVSVPYDATGRHGHSWHFFEHCPTEAPDTDS